MRTVMIVSVSIVDKLCRFGLGAQDTAIIALTVYGIVLWIWAQETGRVYAREPIALWQKTDGELMIVHRCRTCGMSKANLSAGYDDQDALQVLLPQIFMCSTTS